jgi:hypothetical protein
MKMNRCATRRQSAWTLNVVLAAVLAASTWSCGQKQTPYDTNLLKNPSFEDVKDGIPKHWTLENFRGLEDQAEVEYGVDAATAAEGQNSWRFRGDPGTRRWYVLSQEVEVHDITHVRIEGWMQTDQVERKPDQFAQCNYLLIFYDENHKRFQELRFADKRSRLKVGTKEWFEENLVFRVPEGTRYVEVSCILGCDGTAWFDNVRLSVPQPLPWEEQRTKNFVFHSLSDNPYPAGAIESQQRLFDYFAGRLGIESDVVVGYYLYPDTATIRKILSLTGYQYISYDDLEFHSINPNDNHEIIHFMTDVYGVPPRGIAEGTVFWLHDNWAGSPVDDLAAGYLELEALPPLSDMINYNRLALINPNIWIPGMASFVKFIVERWGTERFIKFHKAIAGFNSYDLFAQAFERVYDTPVEETERQWRFMLSRIEVEFPEEQEKQ